MGGFWFRHSQRLIDFVSAECQVQGYPVTLVKPEPFFWTQHHRFRGVETLSPFSAIQTVPDFTRRLMVWSPKIFCTAHSAVHCKAAIHSTFEV